MKEIFTGVYDRLTSAGSFNTAIGGRVYILEAPQRSTFPYCVFFPVVHTPGYTFTSITEEMLLQISLFDEDESPDALETLYGYLASLMDDCTLTISGYVCESCVRESAQLARGDDYWHHWTTYRIRAHKNN